MECSVECNADSSHCHSSPCYQLVIKEYLGLGDVPDSTLHMLRGKILGRPGSLLLVLCMAFGRIACRIPVDLSIPQSYGSLGVS